MWSSLSALKQALGRCDHGFVLKSATVEAGPRVLGHFAPDLSERAARDLCGMGVEIRTGTEVTGIQPGTVQLGAEAIPAETVIWTSGVTATPVAQWLGAVADKGGRVRVGQGLQMPGRPGVYVIGDAALAFDGEGKPLPGLAPVAKQQGRYVARAIRRRLRGRAGMRPFGYRDYGTLATIGRNKAVAEFGPVHLQGITAWITWAVAHIFFLIGFRNRVLVSAQWLVSYATHCRGRRVIVCQDAPPVPRAGRAGTTVLALCRATGIGAGGDGAPRHGAPGSTGRVRSPCPGPIGATVPAWRPSPPFHAPSSLASKHRRSMTSRTKPASRSWGAW